MFEKLNHLGSGTYGNVYLCKYNGMIKAVKEVEYQTDDEILLRSVIRETFLMKNIKHKNLMSTDIIFSKKTKKTNTKIVSYVMDVYSHNLAKQMDIWKEQKSLSLYCLRKVLRQLINGVNYLHQNNVIHRDIKPENILVDSQLNVKLTDYGISRLDYCNARNIKIREVDYVQTLWYRAPEVLLLRYCNNKSDMWSIGCIMYELISCRTSVLFAYNTAKEVLCAVLKTFKINKIDKKLLNIYQLCEKDLEEDERFDLDNRLKGDNKLLNKVYIDLMKNLLQFDPDKRYSAEDCLNHKFMFFNREKVILNMTIPRDIQRLEEGECNNDFLLETLSDLL